MVESRLFSESNTDACLVTVNARKFDGGIHRSWKCKLIDEKQDLWTFVGVFEQEIKHPLLGVIRPKTISYEFYWKTRWYNVFRFHEPDGALRNFYCNVNLPPNLKDNVLNYIDLDIDILVSPSLDYQILDMEEFAENAVKFGYSEIVVENAHRSVDELIRMIEIKSFPFDYHI